MKLTTVKILALASLLAIPLPLAMALEAKAAASALFDQLDTDHDGTVDHKELGDRISAEDWKTADPDNDKTISKDEYLAFVEVAFKRANPDNDPTIDAKEIGRAHV